jgi:hypothetical protein
MLCCLLLACNKSERNNVDLTGTWVDQYSYPTRIVENGVARDTTYPEITYNLRPDGFYDVGNFASISIDPFETGTWSYDENTQIVTMEATDIDSTSIFFNFIKVTSYTWKIETSNESTMTVISTHKTEYSNTTLPNDSVVIIKKREFWKQ